MKIRIKQIRSGINRPDRQKKTLKALGLKRINHIGDWGTQFGMLLSHMKDEYPDFILKATALPATIST